MSQFGHFDLTPVPFELDVCVHSLFAADNVTAHKGHGSGNGPASLNRKT